MACSESTCSRVVEKVLEVRVRRLVQIKRKWFLPHQNAPGAAEENVPPERAPGELIAKIREDFGGDEGLVVEEVECPAGCKCELPEQPQVVEQVDREVDGLELVYVITDVVSSPDWSANPPDIRDERMQPTTINPIVHFLELKAETPVEEYFRSTKYLATATFDLTIERAEFAARCEDDPNYMRNSGEDRRPV